jgi:hypothetical protein
MRVVEPLRRSFHWRGGDRAHDGHALHLRSCYAYLSSVPGPTVAFKSISVHIDSG